MRLFHNFIAKTDLFTFQYGQIYYAGIRDDEFLSAHIYIPIWLDLLCRQYSRKSTIFSDLHSNMVRFIMRLFHNFIAKTDLFTFQYGQIYYAGIRDDEFLSAHIYIPIWLDLLCVVYKILESIWINLHSNMVRFIIVCSFFSQSSLFLFTFQYGQIYYIHTKKN